MKTYKTIVDYSKVIQLAKEATGYHFPTEEQMRKAMFNGPVCDFIHRETLQVMGLPLETEVDEDDHSHYIIEGLICEAAIAIWNERVQ
jgi:hypothetical protein